MPIFNVTMKININCCNTYPLQLDRSGQGVYVVAKERRQQTLNTILMQNCVYATMTDSIHVRTCSPRFSL